MPESSLSPQERVLLLLNQVSNAIIEGRVTPARARPVLQQLLKNKKVRRPSARKLNPRQDGMRPAWLILKLPTRLATSLRIDGPEFLRDLVQLTESNLLARKRIGETSVRVLVSELARYDLRLGMTADEAERVFGPDWRAPRSGGLNPVTRSLADKDIAAEMDFSVRVCNLFREGGIRTLRQLLAVSVSNMPVLLKHSNVCRKEVDRLLQDHGLFVGMSTADIERLLGPPPNASSPSSNTTPAAE